MTTETLDIDEPLREPDRDRAHRSAAKRFTNFVRQNRAFVGVFSAGALVRIVASIAYRPALMFFGDSYLYLNLSRTLKPDPTRPLVYPLFIRALSWAPGGHNLMLLTAVQHLMGLGLGVLVYALARRYDLPRWAATLAAAPVLLNAYQVNIEHFVMAEILFEALLLGGVALSLWNKKPSVLGCVASGVLLALAALSRTVGLGVLPVVFVFLIVRRIGIVRLATFAAGFAVVVAGYSFWFASANHRPGVEGNEGYFFYGRVQTFADCTRLKIPLAEKGLCDAIPVGDRPNLNYYTWGKNTPAHVVSPPPGIGSNSMLRSFSLRAVEGQPLDYAHAVVFDFLHFFRPAHISGRLDEPGATWRFSRALDHAVTWRNAVKLHDNSNPVIARPVAKFVRGYQAAMFPDGPFLAVVLALGVVAPFVLRRRGRLEAGLFVCLAIALLLLPLVTAMFDYRYLLPATPFLSLAAAFGLVGIRSRVSTVRVRVLLLVVIAFFVGGISLAYALGSNPARTAAIVCRKVSHLTYGSSEVTAGAAAQARSQSAYLQERYQAAADEQSGSMARGGSYEQLWSLLTDASVSAGDQYVLERRCARRCGTKTISPQATLLRGKGVVTDRIRLVQDYCGQDLQ